MVTSHQYRLHKVTQVVVDLVDLTMVAAAVVVPVLLVKEIVEHQTVVEVVDVVFKYQPLSEIQEVLLEYPDGMVVLLAVSLSLVAVVVAVVVVLVAMVVQVHQVLAVLSLVPETVELMVVPMGQADKVELAVAVEEEETTVETVVLESFFLLIQHK
jgi:hypothetical protein